MSAPGRRGASIFTQGPAPAGSARGAPIPANEDERRRFPTWSLCPQLRFLARACVLLPGSRRPLQVPRRHRRRLPQHRTSSRGRLRRVPSPPPPHHVPHPGLRHRETRSRPAWVGRPEARPSAPAAGPECRPEACSGHDTLPAGPPRPLAWRVPPGPGSSPHPRVLGTPPVHSWADAPRLNRPLLCQRHSNILRV